MSPPSPRLRPLGPAQMRGFAFLGGLVANIVQAATLVIENELAQGQLIHLGEHAAGRKSLSIMLAE